VQLSLTAATPKADRIDANSNACKPPATVILRCSTGSIKIQ
jgi:hypothetical protein